MTQPDRYSLKVVVQRVVEKAFQRPVYRLIAYDDRQNYQPAEFGSLDGLLQAFRRAVPSFDEHILSGANNIQHTSIIFSEVMELDNAQLSVLGLVRRK